MLDWGIVLLSREVPGFEELLDDSFSADVTSGDLLRQCDCYQEILLVLTPSYFKHCLKW